MSKMQIEYTGGLRNKAIHSSGSEIITDAPVDNHGKGEAFSPTDLLCTALGTCMITIMGIRANKLNVAFENASAQVVKHMSIDPPRKVVKIKVTVQMPASLKEAPERKKIEDAGLTCPVALSIHPDIDQDIEFIYP